jgi:hypothetical protein
MFGACPLMCGGGFAPPNRSREFLGLRPEDMAKPKIKGRPIGRSEIFRTSDGAAGWNGSHILQADSMLQSSLLPKATATGCFNPDAIAGGKFPGAF